MATKQTKLTWKELENHLRQHPDSKGVIVFKQHPSWKKDYSEKERSYWLNGTGNHFQDGKISNSIWGYCLEESSPDADGIRLDWVIYDLPRRRWEIDYCYLLDK